MKLTAAVVVLLATTAGAQDPAQRISPQDAPAHRGTVVTVCGTIEAFTCVDGTMTLTFKESSGFRVVIPPEARGPVERRIEERYLDRQVCVTGRIEQAANLDGIAVATLDDIRIEGESPRAVFAPHAYRPSCDMGVVLPTPTYEQRVRYTPAAIQARVQGSVLMEAVVEADGNVSDARIVKSLDKDLDEQALIAAKQWRFKPAAYKGAAVAAVVTIEMTFTLKSN